MRTARLASHLSVESLQTRMKSAKTPLEFQRFQALYLTSQGLMAPKIASYLGVKAQTVNTWRSLYNRGGMEAIVPVGRGGRRFGLLPLEKERELLQQKLQETKTGLAITATYLKSSFEKMVGKPVSVDYLYDVMSRHGWRKVVPRPQHPSTDTKLQEEFKKKSTRLRR